MIWGFWGVFIFLGARYIGTVLEIFQELRERFSLPEGVFPVVPLTMGYPAKEIKPRRKLGVDIVVHDEAYSDLGDEELLEAYNAKYAGRDSRRVKITEERLKTIRGVCLKVHNEEFAARCMEKVKENGYFSAVQRYFGLHYRADRMPIRNLELMKIREEAGFTWFKEFKPNTA